MQNACSFRFAILSTMRQQQQQKRAKLLFVPQMALIAMNIFWVMKLQVLPYASKKFFFVRWGMKKRRKCVTTMVAATHNTKQKNGSHWNEYCGKFRQECEGGEKEKDIQKAVIWWNQQTEVCVCVCFESFSGKEKKKKITRKYAKKIWLWLYEHKRVYVRVCMGERQRWNRFDLTYGYELNWIAITIGILQIREWQSGNRHTIVCINCIWHVCVCVCIGYKRVFSMKWNDSIKVEIWVRARDG